jgi:hypothetical protein
VTFESDNSALFDYFTTNRIDTITSLPKAGIVMDPVSFCDIIVKNDPISFRRTFEMLPFFTTKDTLHPLFVFVRKAVAIPPRRLGSRP